MKRIHFKNYGQDLLWVDAQPVNDGSGFFRITNVSPACSPQARAYWLRHCIVNIEDLQAGSFLKLSAGPDQEVHSYSSSVLRIENQPA